MGERCPFCWSQNVKKVGAHPKGRLSNGNGRLRECGDCEKWYWADLQQEAIALFRHCQTTIFYPQHCYEEIREIVLSGGNGFLKCRLAEFNHLCAECPNRLFLPGADFYARRKSSMISAR